MPPVDNAYKLRNQEFLQEYAQKPGVKIMFNGVMYREITKGNGPKPSPKSFVTVYYTGTEEQWEQIDIKRENIALKNATIHYNYTGE